MYYSLFLKIGLLKIRLIREGKGSHTLNSAIHLGFENVTEEDSKDYVGIRMADLFVILLQMMIKIFMSAIADTHKCLLAFPIFLIFAIRFIGNRAFNQILFQSRVQIVLSKSWLV